VTSDLFICRGKEKNFVARCGEKYANQFIFGKEKFRVGE
jgi:hypothetical protein